MDERERMTSWQGVVAMCPEGCSVPSKHTHCPKCGLLLAYEVDGHMTQSLVARTHHHNWCACTKGSPEDPDHCADCGAERT